MSKAVNVEVIVRNQDYIEQAIKKFNKKVKKSGILDEVKDRRFYVKKSVRKRLKRKRKLKKSREITEKKHRA